MRGACRPTTLSGERRAGDSPDQAGTKEALGVKGMEEENQRQRLPAAVLRSSKRLDVSMAPLGALHLRSAGRHNSPATPSIPVTLAGPNARLSSDDADCCQSLCRRLCRNRPIPAGVGPCRRASLGNSCVAANSDQTLMNTASAYHCGSRAVTQSSFGLRIRDQGVGGSNPLSPTNVFQQLTAAARGLQTTHPVWPRCPTLPIRIDTAPPTHWTVQDRLQNRPRRCDGRTRCAIQLQAVESKDLVYAAIATRLRCDGQKINDFRGCRSAGKYFDFQQAGLGPTSCWQTADPQSLVGFPSKNLRRLFQVVIAGGEAR